jgi:septal ring factor EnvC (AmiA/AmiB activator)
VSKLYREYWDLNGLHQLNIIYNETNGKLWPFLKLYKELIKKRGMSKEQVAKVVETATHKLPYTESLYKQAKDQAEKMQHTIQRLANDTAALERKISILDKIAFSSEQDCRRKHQEIQELTAQKNRIDIWITNILNVECYSNLKTIVNAVLADNKKLISISFAALIQTIKAEPQIVKLIQNIPCANHGEQHEDDNITKYLESNKNRIMDLSKKNYENLVEALTNGSISNATTSSSNPTVSLPQSSSTFSNPYNQSDTCRLLESETYHNSKGDITE